MSSEDFCACGHSIEEHEMGTRHACCVGGCDCMAYNFCEHESDGEGTCLGCGADLTRLEEQRR